MRNSTRVFSLVGAVMLLGTLSGVGPAARAGGADHFDIFFGNIEAGVSFGRYTFPSPPWEFGDRPGYRCAWGFLTSGGQQVARVQFDRGQSYTQVNDAFGQERDNDFSQCLPEGEQRETKPKPAGLGDTIVTFDLGGVPLATMTFPATSPTDADSWWELEEAEGDAVEVELYWKQEVAVVATITSLSSSMTFSVRSTAPPVINSFAPPTGGIGTTVDIVGANLIGASAVTFNGVPAEFDQESAGEIVATVPVGATTGPIAVTTPAGSVTSATSFTVAVTSVAHESRVTLGLSGHLVASGSVQMLDGAIACLPGRAVTIERRVNGVWRTVGTDETGDSGAYRTRVKDKAGRYRATIGETTLANGDTCLSDVSRKREY